MTFGEKIKALRIEKGVTAAEVGKSIDRKEKYIWALELGKKNKKRKWAPELAKYFNIEVDYLLQDNIKRENATTFNDAACEKFEKSTNEALKLMDKAMRPLAEKLEKSARTTVALTVPEEQTGQVKFRDNESIYRFIAWLGSQPKNPESSTYDLVKGLIQHYCDEFGLAEPSTEPHSGTGANNDTTTQKSKPSA